MHPVARTDRLIVQELSDETIVYDEDAHRAHCLNRSAALVWLLCDGQISVAELAHHVERELGVPASEDLVWLTLRRLQRARLLATPLEAAPSRTRREVARR